MGIKRSLFKRLGKNPRVALPEVRWQHAEWPARSIGQFVVSFPESGRTWLRVLMGAAEAHRHGVAIESEVAQWLSQAVPTLGGRPVLFTHGLSEEGGTEPLEHVDLLLRYIGEKRRVFLLRDPRDTVVSYYFQRVKREDRPAGLPTELSAFLRHPDWGIDRILLFQGACLRSFDEDRGPALLLTYEDLHKDAAASLRLVLAFFGIPDVPRAALDAAVNNELRAIDPNDPNDPETFKTRKGKVGSYVEHLSAADVVWIEERIRDLLPLSLAYRTPGVGPEAQEHG